MQPYPNMTPISTEKFKELFEQFTQKMREIGLGEKHKEYASQNDCLSNFRVYSWHGILCTITQKLGRMINYSTRDERVSEAVFMNDCLDTAFYMFLMFCCYKAEQKSHVWPVGIEKTCDDYEAISSSSPPARIDKNAF